MISNINKGDALLALAPGAEWVVRDGKIEWLSDDIPQPTDAAVQAKYDELVAAEPMRQLREERNRLIAETDWWASSDLTMTDAQKKYRQDLRDITKTYSSLDDVKWPEKPSG
tara:strand:+ start:313 stop:648 length:336 start_codon:yes stop_codon:yes gene_type:complete